jgi:hypothetical protein
MLKMLYVTKKIEKSCPDEDGQIYLPGPDDCAPYFWIVLPVQQYPDNYDLPAY